MLIMATAAACEIRARGLDTVRGRFNDFSDASSGEAGLLFGELRFDFLAGKNEWDEYGFAAAAIVGGKASESIAAIDQLFDV